jgi:hypothetical protein
VDSHSIRWYEVSMTHGQMVDAAVGWLRRQRCGVVLSEQGCSSGEMADAIGWKGKCHSIVVECKVSRGDFLADAAKPWRVKPETALGCERYYLAPRGMIKESELPAGWGLLELHAREVKLVRKSKRKLRQEEGFKNEMNLLLASLIRVEVRIEPKRITDFLKWKNRIVEYNGGCAPEGVTLEELNPHL